MYDFSEELHNKYRNDALFHIVMNYQYSTGKSKEEALESFVIALLDLKHEAFQKEVDRIFRSPIPSLFGTKQ